MGFGVRFYLKKSNYARENIKLYILAQNELHDANNKKKANKKQRYISVQHYENRSY